MLITNLINDNGNAAVNQFVIVNGTNVTFQSYRTPIVTICNLAKKIILNEDAFNYSRTTSKHLRIFCKQNNICFESLKKCGHVDKLNDFAVEKVPEFDMSI